MRSLLTSMQLLNQNNANLLGPGGSPQSSTGVNSGTGNQQNNQQSPAGGQTQPNNQQNNIHPLPGGLPKSNNQQNNQQPVIASNTQGNANTTNNTQTTQQPVIASNTQGNANATNNTQNTQQASNTPFQRVHSNTQYTSPVPNTLVSTLGNIAGDYLRDRMLRNAYQESYDKYLQRIKDLGTQVYNQGGKVTAASFYNAAGDVGHNVPQAYERALTRVRATPEAMLAYSQSLGTAGQLLGAADAAARATQAAAQSQAAGVRRQAAQIARNIGNAAALRDILAATAGQSVGAMQQAADTASRSIGANLGQAGQLMQQAAMIPQQSQMVQYQLFARPREAQLNQQLGSYYLTRPVPYDAPTARWAGLTGSLFQIAGNHLARLLMGNPPISMYEATYPGPHVATDEARIAPSQQKENNNKT
jgi:hypothetical protein